MRLFLRSCGAVCAWVCVLCLAFLPMIGTAQRPDSTTFLFAGSYTNGLPGDGIRVYRFDNQTGKLRRTFALGGLVNPSFLTLSPCGRYLYACTESKLPHAGSVSAFAFDPKAGRLRRLNRQSSGGQNPVYVRVHPSGKFLLVANYGSPTLALFPILPDGSLAPQTQLWTMAGQGPIPGRQEAAHPHGIAFSPDGRYAIVPDLGSDALWVYAVESDPPSLQPRPDLTVHTRPGSGPRHFTFHPAGDLAYCIEELSGCVTVYRYADGRLDSLQRIFAYSKIQASYGSADIHLSPDGRHLYVSNRWDQENTIACFEVEAGTGLLCLLGHVGSGGDHPRSFCMAPDGSFVLVANQESGTINVFARDPGTGLLTPTDEVVKMSLPSSLKLGRYPR